MPNQDQAPAELSPLQVAGLVRVMTETLRAEVDALPAEALSWHPAPGEWCVNEVLGHLIEAERRGFGGRIRAILAAPHPDLEGWDQEAVERERRDCDRDGRELVRELARAREEGIQTLLSLQPHDLFRSGRHPVVGELQVRHVMQEWVYHDRNHVKQIFTNIQAYVWPHMGHAQKFSDM